MMELLKKLEKEKDSQKINKRSEISRIVIFLDYIYGEEQKIELKEVE